MAKVKNNLAPRNVGGIIEWTGRTAETADSLLQKKRDKQREGQDDRKLDLAKAFLLTKLEGGRKRMMRELATEAEAQQGIKLRTLYRAQEALGVVSDFGKPAYWSFAPQVKHPEMARAATVEDIL